MEISHEEVQVITNADFVKVTLTRDGVHTGYLYLNTVERKVLGEVDDLNWESFLKLSKRFKKEVSKLDRANALDSFSLDD